MEKSMIDATIGGALMDKTPIVARQLISNFDLGCFDWAYDEFDDYVVACSICAEISSTILFDCYAGESLDPLISLPPVVNLPLPSII